MSAIWSVNGCSNFSKSIDYFNEYLSITDLKIAKIIYMIDRDLYENNEDLLKNFKRTPHQDIDCHFKNFNYVNGFKKEISFKAMVLIIPSDTPGALETVFLNELKKSDTERKIIVEHTESFVDSFDQKSLKNYLTRNREKLKAKFLTVLSLIEPIRSFDKVDALIKSFNWHESEEINQIFKIFEEI